jgi:hypothetical protein
VAGGVVDDRNPSNQAQPVAVTRAGKDTTFYPQDWLKSPQGRHVVLWIVVLAGGRMLAVGVKALVDSHRFVAHAVRTEAVVVCVRTEVRRECNGSGTSRTCSDHTYRYPSVRFLTPNERAVTFEGDNDGSLRVGDSVTVAYDPTNPQHAILDNWASHWGQGVLFTAGGLLLAVIGGTGIAWRRCRARRAAHGRGAAIADSAGPVDSNGQHRHPAALPRCRRGLP